MRRARRRAAAAVLQSAGFTDQAISRAYYGAFYAAEAALLAIGETRSKRRFVGYGVSSLRLARRAARL